MMQEIVRAAGMVGFQRLVDSLGGDSRTILARAGLDDVALADPDRYIPYRSLLSAFEDAATSLRVPDFGLRLAAQQDISFLGPLALAIQYARNVREGLLVAARHINFHAPALVIDMDASDEDGLERIGLRFVMSGLPPIPQAVEHAVAHLYKVVTILSDGRIAPNRIHFSHDPIGSLEDYLDHFGQIPAFGSSYSGIAIRSVDLRYHLPRSNSQMQSFVEQFLIGAAPPAHLSVPDQVRGTLVNLIRVQQVSLQDVARVLRCHPRTLQRRLLSGGTSFAALHDDIRKETAERLLLQPTVPLAIVARTIGFNDQAALNRACRRWFACTPGDWRRRALSDWKSTA
jgi:AraC-like DNA-binding protein